MNAKELIAKYAYKRIYASVRRAGGMYRDIDKGVVYELSSNGSMHYVKDVLWHNPIANHAQWDDWNNFTGGHYYCGRPTAEAICKQYSDAEIDKLFSDAE